MVLRAKSGHRACSAGPAVARSTCWRVRRHTGCLPERRARPAWHPPTPGTGSGIPIHAPARFDESPVQGPGSARPVLASVLAVLLFLVMSRTHEDQSNPGGFHPRQCLHSAACGGGSGRRAKPTRCSEIVCRPESRCPEPSMRGGAPILLAGRSPAGFAHQVRRVASSAWWTNQGAGGT